MGVLNFHDEPYHLAHIRSMLSRRGYKPDLRQIWEIHGPHDDVQFHIYVGYAFKPGSKLLRCLAITPRNVYEVQEPILWWNRTLANRIEPV